MSSDLPKEYAKIADALANWFISQEISVDRAAGVCMYLAGVTIGECAHSEADINEGVRRHLAVLEHVAQIAFERRK